MGVVFAAVVALSPSSTALAKLSESQLNMFSQNNILFYDPTGGGVACYSGNLSGDTIMAKVVNYLSGNNPSGFTLSANAIAGVLANFQGESGFNPFRFQSDSLDGPGYGIAQFTPKSKITDVLRSDARTANYFNEYYDLKYTYYDHETGIPTETVPMEVVDAWLAVQLDYFFGPSSEFETTKVGGYRNLGGSMGLSYIGSDMTVHEAMEAAQSPEDATRIFVWIMERPGDKEGASNRRSVNAQGWLDYVNRMAPGIGADSTSTSVSGSDVTIIGDSITEGSKTQLSQALSGAEIYSQVSKQFYTGTSDNPGGIEILRDLADNGNLRKILVYALGTNSSITAEQAQEVVDLAGSERTVVFVTNWTTSNDYTANNNVFAKMKNDNSNVLIADWKSAVESDAGTYLGGDGIHPNEAGRALFAQIIANTVGSSSGLLGACIVGSVEGGLTEDQAQRLADYYNSSEVDANYWGLPFGKKNCVSFSAFFAQRFTSIGRASRGWGNGKDVAHNLAQADGLPTGNDPRPWSIFSVTSGVTMCEDGYLCGHTGVVVGVQDDKIITVEAAYPSSDAYVSVHDKSYFVNQKYGYSFVYLETILNQSDLSQVIGG